MSGGRFEYKQHQISEIVDELKIIISSEKRDPEFSAETLKEFKKGLEALKKAYIYVQRIDWLLSFDDGEESFHRRLKKELANSKQ